MILNLTRDYDDGVCTLGTLELPGNTRRLQTIERPWVPDPICKSGRKYVSCIADGTYRLEPRETESRGKHWIISNPDLDVYRYPQDVPAGRETTTRTLVLIHAGNYVDDVIGCVAPGKTRAKVNGRWMVGSSRDAINELRQALNGAIDLKLVIRRANESAAQTAA